MSSIMGDVIIFEKKYKQELKEYSGQILKIADELQRTVNFQDESEKGTK